MNEGSGSDKGKAKGSPQLGIFGTAIKPLSVDRAISRKVKRILDEVDKAKLSFSMSRQQEDDIKKHRKKLNVLLERLDKEVDKPDTPDSVKDVLRKEIAALRGEIERPNLPQPPHFPQQLEARQRAADFLREWEEAEPGVTLNALEGQQVARENLEACTTGDLSPMQIVLHTMLGIRPGEDRTGVSAARVKFAQALHMSIAPQFFGLQIPDMAAVQANTKKERDLLECIAKVACEECQKDYNPLSVFGEAAFQNPTQFWKDVIGGGFAVGVLAELLGPTALGIIRELPSVLFSGATRVGQNPLASFTTFKVTQEYIQPLLEQVFRERFGPREQQGHNIRQLFDELSKYYVREGVTDIIGFPPADLGSMSNKVKQALHYFGSRVVVGAQSMGDMVKSAMSFPGAVCSGVMHMGQSVKRWACDNAMRLLSKYRFIPVGIEEGMFVRILKCLDDKNLLEDPNINKYIIAFLKLNKPSTVLQKLVQRHMAVDDMTHGTLLGAHEMSQGMSTAASQEPPNPDDMEGVGLSSGPLSEPWNIHGEPTVPSSNGAELRDFRVRTMESQMSASRDAVAARQLEDKEAARLAAGRPSAFPRPGVQGGVQGGNLGISFPSGAAARSSPASAQGGVQSSSLASLTGTGSNLSAAFARPSASGGLGGHSRSRKRSVSKRTRRKGVAKKQKSKKNKRQSRRKVRRASSHKSRK
jgi:hypothetical protein